MKKVFLMMAVLAMAQSTEISGERIRAHVKFLASDLLEGRGVGARGGDLATEYIAAQLALVGAKPAGDAGTYFQNLTLVGVEPQAASTLTAGDTSFRWLDDFVGVTYQQKTDAAFDADAVFVGHGIVAPEYQWDDYAGVNVRGKVVVLFTNEPPSDDPKFFAGKALTYYGRWTFKFEEAARRGAKACLIIHTTETAGYPFTVVQRLEGAQLKRNPNDPALAFAGWLSRQAGEKLLAMCGRTVDSALREANTRGFKAVPMGVRIKGRIPTKVENFVSKNVIGMIEGSDENLKSEAVAFTAHWDHLGVGRAVLGDSVYHGAADNGTGCAILM